MGSHSSTAPHGTSVLQTAQGGRGKVSISEFFLVADQRKCWDLVLETVAYQMSWFNMPFECSPACLFIALLARPTLKCLPFPGGSSSLQSGAKELEVAWLLHGSSFYRLALNSLKSKCAFSACERWALGVLPRVVSHAGEVGGGTLALLNSDANLGIRSCLNVFIQRPHSQQKLQQLLVCCIWGGAGCNWFLRALP